MYLDLSGKWALVGGSSKGIGLAVAQELSRLGASVILTGRDETALMAAKATLAGPNETVVVDFQSNSSIDKLLAGITEKGRTINILVNNAGGPPSGSFMESRADAMIQALNTHLFAMDQMSRALAPGMRSSGYGRIVNIVSVTARVPLKNMILSNTVRGAVLNWSKTVSLELAPYGITVNNILPGYTRTQRAIDLWQSLSKNQGCSPEDIEKNWKSQVPMGRLAEPEEIANVVAFLCSPAASFVTGISMPVDGGWTPSV